MSFLINKIYKLDFRLKGAKLKTTLDESIIFLINKTALALKNSFESKLKSFNITSVQFYILKRLWEEDEITQKELSDRTFKKPSEITHIIDKLENKGFIKRNQSKTDRRVYIIKLTKKGQELEDELNRALDEHHSKSVEGISDKELLILKSDLESIYNNISK